MCRDTRTCGNLACGSSILSSESIRRCPSLPRRSLIAPRAGVSTCCDDFSRSSTSVSRTVSIDLNNWVVEGSPDSGCTLSNDARCCSPLNTCCSSCSADSEAKAQPVSMPGRCKPMIGEKPRSHFPVSAHRLDMRRGVRRRHACALLVMSPKPSQRVSIPSGPIIASTSRCPSGRVIAKPIRPANSFRSGRSKYSRRLLKPSTLAPASLVAPSKRMVLAQIAVVGGCRGSRLTAGHGRGPGQEPRRRARRQCRRAGSTKMAAVTSSPL